MRARGWDWPGDDLELGFGSGDDGCVVGHFGCCFGLISIKMVCYI